MDAVLNVDHSFTGKNWRSRVDGDEVARDRRATALAQRLELPAIVAQILADRNSGQGQNHQIWSDRESTVWPETWCK